jgi:hypothetical protein
MKKIKKEKCIVCGKNTLVKDGWHLKPNLNFCSYHCIATYIEVFHKNMIKDLNKIEKRLELLEKQKKK